MSNVVANNDVLRLDSIISTQPNIGPAIPDGGYGWVIVVAVGFFQALIPSLITGYGTLLLFNRVEIAPPMDPYLWDVKLMYVPLVYMLASSFFDPLSRKLIVGNKWQIYVGYAGTCLTCSGLILLWFAIRNVSRLASIYVFSGLLSGIGASILTALSDIIIIQYFKLKLRSVNIVLQSVASLGFIFTPIMLGNLITINGIANTLLWYGVVILQGVIVSLLLKRPEYLKKNPPSNYKLIKEIGGDEEDIFSKSATELRTTVYSMESHMNDEEASTSNVSNPNGLIDFQIAQAGNNWEQFDDESKSSGEPNDNLPKVHKSYAKDFNEDLNKIEKFDDDFVNFPKPLYEAHVNNNTTYAFDNAEDIGQTSNIFLPPPEKESFLTELKTILRKPTLYKSLIHTINFRFSLFIFFTLFPSFLYNKIDYIKDRHASFVVGIIGVTGLLFATMNYWITNGNNSNKRATFLAALSWLGSLGYMIIPDVKNEAVFIMGAIFVFFSINAMQYIGEPLLKIDLMGETTTTHTFLSFCTSLSFLIFVFVDFSYYTCFKIVSVLQFVNGSMWFTNFVHKKIKSIRSTMHN